MLFVKCIQKSVVSCSLQLDISRKMCYNVQETHKISCIGVTDMAQSITSADILKELNIKRSTFYYLLKNNLISIPTTDTGRYAWNNEVVEQLKIVLSEPQETEKEMPEIKTTKINNRRYLGNKYKLLDFITSTVARECVGVNTVADILPEQARWLLLFRTKINNQRYTLL